MEDALGFVIVGANFAIYGCCLFGFHWALIPLDCAAKERGGAMQFNLADILCLFVPTQLLLGVVYWAMRHSESHAKEWEWDIGIVVAMGVIWWYLVRMLSRADIRVVWQRCVVLMVAPLLAFAGGAILNLPGWPLHLLGAHHTVAACGLLLVTAGLLGGTVYGFGRFVDRIVGTETPPERACDIDDPSDSQPTNSGSMTRICRQRPWRKRPQ